jgi:hypothetical protein
MDTNPVLQPRAVFDRIDPVQTQVVCSALNIELPRHWLAAKLFGLFPSVANWWQYRKLRARISRLRGADVALTELSGGIMRMPLKAAAAECAARGLAIAEDGTSSRVAVVIAAGEDDRARLSKRWLTEWLAHSALRGYDPCFLCMWSLDLQTTTATTPGWGFFASPGSGTGGSSSDVGGGSHS